MGYISLISSCDSIRDCLGELAFLFLEKVEEGIDEEEEEDEEVSDGSTSGTLFSLLYAAVLSRLTFMFRSHSSSSSLPISLEVFFSSPLDHWH